MAKVLNVLAMSIYTVSANRFSHLSRWGCEAKIELSCTRILKLIARAMYEKSFEIVYKNWPSLEE